MQLRAMVAVAIVVVMSSVSGGLKVLWHRYRVHKLKLSDSGCYLAGWLFSTRTLSLYSSGSTAFGFPQRPIQPERTFAIARKRTRGFGFGWT